MLLLLLSYDHRMISGVTAVRLTKRLGKLLADIHTLLLQYLYYSPRSGQLLPRARRARLSVPPSGGVFFVCLTTRRSCVPSYYQRMP